MLLAAQLINFFFDLSYVIVIFFVWPICCFRPTFLFGLILSEICTWKRAYNQHWIDDGRMGASADFLGSLEVFRRRYPRLRWVAWRGVVLGFRLDSLAGAISGLTLPGVVGRSPRCHALREGPKAPSLCRLRRAWRRWCRLRRVGLGRAPVPPRRCGGGFFAGRGPRRRDMGGCE